MSEQHVMTALDGATSGPVAEGTVGAGTGMVSYGFKGGIGTSSRQLSEKEGGYTVGVLVNANHGRRPELIVSGVPVGKLYEPPLSCRKRSYLVRVKDRSSSSLPPMHPWIVGSSSGWPNAPRLVWPAPAPPYDTGAATSFWLFRQPT